MGKAFAAGGLFGYDRGSHPGGTTARISQAVRLELRTVGPALSGVNRTGPRPRIGLETRSWMDRQPPTGVRPGLFSRVCECAISGCKKTVSEWKLHARSRRKTFVPPPFDRWFLSASHAGNGQWPESERPSSGRHRVDPGDGCRGGDGAGGGPSGSWWVPRRRGNESIGWGKGGLSIPKGSGSGRPETRRPARMFTGTPLKAVTGGSVPPPSPPQERGGGVRTHDAGKAKPQPA